MLAGGRGAGPGCLDTPGVGYGRGHTSQPGPNVRWPAAAAHNRPRDPIVWGSTRLGQAKGDSACKASLSLSPGAFQTQEHWDELRRPCRSWTVYHQRGHTPNAVSALLAAA
eukprot:363901-Chlamydomonas_euryale.AAC.12